MRGTKAVLLVSLPVATVAFFLGEAIVYVWIDSAEIVLPPYVMELVSLSYLVSAFIWTSSTILLGISRLKEMLFISLVEAVLALILIVFAVPTYGLLGLVMGFAVANGVISLFVLVPYTCRTLSLPVSTFLRSSLTDPVMAALPAVFVAALLGNYLPPASWPLLIAEVVSILLLFGLSYFFLCIESQQRHQILRWAANRVGVY